MLDSIRKVFRGGQMRGMLGCSGMIAAVGFAVGAVGGLVAMGPNFAEVFGVALFVGAITFVGALFLIVTDRQEDNKRLARVREELLKREKCSDAAFASAFPEIEPALLLLVRDGIADFFGVPAAKIHPSDQLQGDFQFESLEPAFHTHVAYYVLAELDSQVSSFCFNAAELSNVGDLAREIQRIVKSAESDNS